MRISDWSSDVCSSDLCWSARTQITSSCCARRFSCASDHAQNDGAAPQLRAPMTAAAAHRPCRVPRGHPGEQFIPGTAHVRSEEHTSELQSLMRISYAVFCLKKKNRQHTTINNN